MSAKLTKVVTVMRCG